MVIASEPITDEDWIEVPEGSVFGVELNARTMHRTCWGRHIVEGVRPVGSRTGICACWAIGVTRLVTRRALAQPLGPVRRA